MPNDNAHNYGSYYWCIALTDDAGTEVYVNADSVTVENGALICWQYKENEHNHPTLAFAEGEWKFFFAASVMDGHAIAVNHWPGQISE